jgi:hypothetical protein
MQSARVRLPREGEEMAVSADHIMALARAHGAGDESGFYSVALQMAASAARGLASLGVGGRLRPPRNLLSDGEVLPLLIIEFLFDKPLRGSGSDRRPVDHEGHADQPGDDLRLKCTDEDPEAPSALA